MVKNWRRKWSGDSCYRGAVVVCQSLPVCPSKVPFTQHLKAPQIRFFNRRHRSDVIKPVLNRKVPWSFLGWNSNNGTKELFKPLHTHSLPTGLDWQLLILLLVILVLLELSGRDNLPCYHSYWTTEFCDDMLFQGALRVFRVDVIAQKVQNAKMWA